MSFSFVLLCLMSFSNLMLFCLTSFSLVLLSLASFSWVSLCYVLLWSLIKLNVIIPMSLCLVLLCWASTILRETFLNCIRFHFPEYTKNRLQIIVLFLPTQRYKTFFCLIYNYDVSRHNCPSLIFMLKGSILNVEHLCFLPANTLAYLAKS